MVQDMLLTCVICHTPFKRRSATQVTCSNRCYMYNRRQPGKADVVRSCIVCDAMLPFDTHRAAKYCSPLCRAAASKRRTGRAVSAYLRYDNCAHCGSALNAKAGTRFCSANCWQRDSFGHSYAALASRQCEHCGTALPAASRVNKRHCSDRCTVLANQAVRHARRKKLPVERISRYAIFERDGWICHICQSAVDPTLYWPAPGSATLDHLIALNDPDSPGHVWVNVACSHARCNLSKNHRTRPEDRELHLRLAAMAAAAV